MSVDRRLNDNRERAERERDVALRAAYDFMIVRDSFGAKLLRGGGDLPHAEYSALFIAKNNADADLTAAMAVLGKKQTQLGNAKRAYQKAALAADPTYPVYPSNVVKLETKR